MFSSASLTRINSYHFCQKMLSFRRDCHAFREHVCATGNTPVKFFVCGASEGELSTEHGIEENSSWPYISRRTQIFSFLNNLWAHVRWCTTKYLESNLIAWLGEAAETKINKFYDSSLIDNYVLKFDIPVCNISLVQVIENRQQLLDNQLCFFLTESSMRLRL